MSGNDIWKWYLDMISGNDQKEADIAFNPDKPPINTNWKLSLEIKRLKKEWQEVYGLTMKCIITIMMLIILYFNPIILLYV